jgi:TDG/mug DNA glycosylase family protein
VRKARRRVRIRSFAPVASRNARALILGSMPGKKSLDACEYYAHKQNAFWRIVGELLGIEPHAPYRKRIQAVKAARIAVWDVLHSCTRSGSLDAGIDRDSEIANDFRGFFRTHRNITHVFFNGAKAAASFERSVLPGLGIRRLRYIRLPSTSPANASVRYERKREAWRVVLKSAKRNCT